MPADALIDNPDSCHLNHDLKTVIGDGGAFVPVNSSYDGLLSYTNFNIVINSPSDLAMMGLRSFKMRFYTSTRVIEQPRTLMLEADIPAKDT